MGEVVGALADAFDERRLDRPPVGVERHRARSVEGDDVVGAGQAGDGVEDGRDAGIGRSHRLLTRPVEVLDLPDVARQDRRVDADEVQQRQRREHGDVASIAVAPHEADGFGDRDGCEEQHPRGDLEVVPTNHPEVGADRDRRQHGDGGEWAIEAGPFADPDDGTDDREGDDEHADRRV